MREDKEAAMREYRNIFTNEGSDAQIIKRADIIRNSVPRLPKLRNDDGQSKWGLLYDCARAKDNSVILCAEYYQDPVVGWKMKIQNVVNLINIEKKNKTPMTTPNQIKELKRLILAYNGEGKADYENIISICIDAGSGGAGVNISDFLWEDWEDDDGNIHRGLIDKDYSPEEVSLYPNAIKDKLHLLQPTKYKVEMFKALIEMTNMNLIEWPNEYDNRGYINLMFELNTKTGQKIPRYNEPTEKEVKKTELVNIYRFKQASGADRFDLAPDKSSKLNDDRAYVAAMGAWVLQQLRREHLITRKKQNPNDILSKLVVSNGKHIDKIFG